MSWQWPNVRVEVLSAGETGLNQTAVETGSWSGWFRHHTLWWVREGQAKLRGHGGAIETIEPGVMVWFRPGFEYGFAEPLAGWLGLWAAHFELREQPAGERVDRVGVRDVMRPSEPAFAEAMMRRLAGLGEKVPGQHHRAFRGHRRERAERLLTELLIELSEQHPADDGEALAEARDPTDVQMQKIGQRIATRREREWSVEQLAAEAGLSVAQFGTRFGRVNREKPQQFITRHRIATAMQLLSETALPVSEVTRLSGYASVYYFSRVFKNHTGKSPTGFRRGASETHNPP